MRRRAGGTDDRRRRRLRAHARRPASTELPDWPYEPQYVEIDGLRQAYVDEGPADGEVVLLLHGQPSWSYLYRKMIPVLTDAGYRVIAMDHLGMGRSDKPIDIERYSYLDHNEPLAGLRHELESHRHQPLRAGLGQPHRAARRRHSTPTATPPSRSATARCRSSPRASSRSRRSRTPTNLPTSLAVHRRSLPSRCPSTTAASRLPTRITAYFGDWMTYAMTAESFQPSEVVEALHLVRPAVQRRRPPTTRPFPSRIYMAGTRIFPSLINDLPGETADAWAGLMSYQQPFLTLWAGERSRPTRVVRDATTLHRHVPGAQGQPHDRLPEASHFLQNDQGTEIAERLVDWYDTVADAGDAETKAGE